MSSHQVVGKKRWFVAFVLLIGGFINYLDRASLAVAAPSMMSDLHLSNTDIGLMGSVFSLFFAFSQFPAGWLADRFGPRKVYASAASLWGLSTMITGLCSTLPALLCARALLGMTEAPGWPTSAKITSIWFPRKERALASSIWDASSRWGLAFAPPLLVLMSIHFGWGALFYLAGSLGVIFGLIFFFIYRHPEQHQGISRAEKQYILAGGGGSISAIPAGQRVKWRELFRYQSMWGMMLGWFCYIWLFNIFVTFLPLYLMKTQHLSLSSMGVYASIPYLAGIIGAALGGYAVKWLIDQRKVAEPLKAKKVVIMVAALISGATTIAVPFCDSLVAALSMMTVAMFFLSAVSCTCWAIPGDVASNDIVGSVCGIQNFGGFFAGALSPLVTGYIADVTGSYALAFISGGGIAALTGLCYWFLVRKPIEHRDATTVRHPLPASDL
ncbi:MFS transporter [Pantoea cypripedii]|uniref:MFS transporter n=1 Tax=Pantoea cypripedii TaxID=55209 RepID=UPI002FCA7CC0